MSDVLYQLNILNGWLHQLITTIVIGKTWIYIALILYYPPLLCFVKLNVLNQTELALFSTITIYNLGDAFSCEAGVFTCFPRKWLHQSLPVLCSFVQNTALPRTEPKMHELMQRELSLYAQLRYGSRTAELGNMAEVLVEKVVPLTILITTASRSISLHPNFLQERWTAHSIIPDTPS